jgi:hypothetical protein
MNTTTDTPDSFSPIAVEDPEDAEHVEEGATRAGCRKHNRTLPIGAGLLVFVGFLAVAVIRKLDAMHEEYSDTYAGFAHASLGKGEAVSLAALPAAHAPCVNNGGTCFCSRTGGCKQWTFQVGDVLIFSYGPNSNAELTMINNVMRLFYQGAVHSAIVTEVNGAALSSIIVTEVIKGMKNRVIRSTMEEVLNYRQYHGVWIRRVDAARFPKFARKGAALASWGNARLGEPFDKGLMLKKVVLFPWRWFDDNWIAPNPDCGQRHKAMDLYHRGGPGKWFCSQFVAWTLAFPGGLNTDYGAGQGLGASSSAGCSLPSWDGKVDYLQPAPGDLIQQSFYDQSNFYMDCPKGCDNGLLAR